MECHQFFASVFLMTLAVLSCGFSIAKKRQPCGGLGMLNPSFAYISKYPFTVAVIVDADLLGGGALIEKNWVLTVASLMEGFKPSEMKVRLGSNSAFHGGVLHDVTDAIIHPNYTGDSSYNLALLKLHLPVHPRVARKVTYIARIPFKDNGIAGNMTGFGSTSSPQANCDPGVQVAEGSVYTATYCQRHWNHSVSSLNICAFSKYAVPCYGDDGDPVSRCWGHSKCELLGIFTGIDKCDNYEPYALMDVGQFAPWIFETINKTTTS